MKTIRFAIVILATLFLFAACSSDPKSGKTADLAVADIVELVPEKDLAQQEVGGSEETGGEEIVAGDELFQVGVAVGECPAPLGIPTAGYGEATDAQTPKSPFTVGFGATVRQHTPILAKACYLRRGEDELLVIRLDKIGTTPELLDEFTRRLDKKTGRNWDGKVILASNHSHLAPGRLWENMVGEFANDMFWPFYYNRYIDALVDTAVLALADAEPARFGYGRTECPECHNDRRCENPELLDSTLWVVRFDRADGTPKAIWLDFAIHGTVFGWQDFVLSGDAPGIMEHKLEETFDSPVDVFMFQSWGGDVSPADPEVAVVEPVNEEIPGNYSRLERIGFAAAKRIVEVLPEIETTEEVEFGSITLRPPIGYDLLGYEAGEFDYANGGMMCGAGSEAPCWGEGGEAPAMGCIPMPVSMAPDQFVLSAFSINELLFFTLPGEPHTDLSLETVEAVQAATGWEDVVVVGYAQDHWGYIMKSYDWLLGGYEPTVSFWGPAQGDYIAAQVPHVVARLLDPDYEFPFEPLAPLAPLDLTKGDKYTAQNSVAESAVVEEPAESIAPTGAAVFIWSGGDPWLGTPLVALEWLQGSEWAAVTLANGKPFDNHSFHMETSLEWVPGWKEDKEATAREFLWKVVLPAKRNVPTPSVLVPGTYRLKASGNIRVGGVIAAYETVSSAFELE